VLGLVLMTAQAFCYNANFLHLCARAGSLLCGGASGRGTLSCCHSP
jgi:hypothetical protein